MGRPSTNPWRDLSRPLLIAAVASACITFDPIENSSTISLSGVSGPTAGSGAMLPVEPALLTLGAPCSNGELCSSGHCSDGVCCDEACADSCVRCDLPTGIGTCQPSASNPTGTHPACLANDSLCAGGCTGLGRECSYPDASVRCGASCDGQCTGSGSCSGGAAGACPNGFACGDASCKTACATGSDCAPNFECVAPACTRIPEANCLDGADDNGDGLIDCADPTCLGDEVECVSDPGGGAELGYRSATSCDPAYPVATSLHQTPGPNSGSCTNGCSCTAPASRKTLALYQYPSSNDCVAGSETIDNISVRSDWPVGTCAWSLSSGTCTATNPDGVRPSTVAIIEGGTSLVSPCGASNLAGSATPPATSWGTTQTFCGAAMKTSTCAAGQSCVAKTTQKRCVRSAGNTTCTGGVYTTEQHWFADFGADTRTCSDCTTLGCSATTRTLSSVTFMGAGAAPSLVCSVGSAGPSPLSNVTGIRWPTHGMACDGHALPACSDSNCYNHYCSLSLSSIAWTGGSCTVSSAPVITGGAVAGSGPSTTCCEP